MTCNTISSALTGALIFNLGINGIQDIHRGTSSSVGHDSSIHFPERLDQLEHLHLVCANYSTDTTPINNSKASKQIKMRHQLYSNGVINSHIWCSILMSFDRVNWSLSKNTENLHSISSFQSRFTWLWGLMGVQCKGIFEGCWQCCSCWRSVLLMPFTCTQHSLPAQ